MANAKADVPTYWPWLHHPKVRQTQRERKHPLGKEWKGTHSCGATLHSHWVKHTESKASKASGVPPSVDSALGTEAGAAPSVAPPPAGGQQRDSWAEAGWILPVLVAPGASVLFPRSRHNWTLGGYRLFGYSDVGKKQCFLFPIRGLTAR